MIPLWSPDQAPTFESELTGKGGIVFNSSSPESEEVERAVDDLGSALEARLGTQRELPLPSEPD